MLLRSDLIGKLPIALDSSASRPDSMSKALIMQLMNVDVDNDERVRQLASPVAMKILANGESNEV